MASPYPLVFSHDHPQLAGHRKKIAEAWAPDEAAHLAFLLKDLELDDSVAAAITQMANDLVSEVRARAAEQSPLDAFMQQYDLSSEEGILLMCLAEALLRIPDADTADKLIADKLSEAEWKEYLGKSDSLFVNASTWGLMLTGKMTRLSADTTSSFRSSLKRLVGKSGEPVIRVAVRQAMRVMGHQFVMGRTIAEAQKRSRGKEFKIGDYRFSYDMLGEAALTQADADRYFQSYRDAIAALGNGGSFDDVFAAPSISVKLSALHPRYEIGQRHRVMDELVPKVVQLAGEAKALGIGLTIDAEETERLQLSLDVIEAVYRDQALDGWEGFGLAVQAYQKRAPLVIDYLAGLINEVGRRMPVRLVKGAYWDSEIKHAQEEGLLGYPVFTRKPNTDVSYLACAKRLLAQGERFFPQFATHNARTVAAIYHLADDPKGFEYQRLHGMGEEVYDEIVPADKLGVPCRVYAPVGSHEDLLPYLVRRLLENGANTSFVNRIADDSLPIEEVIADPVELVRANRSKGNPRIGLPVNLYGDGRRNSAGLNLFDELSLSRLAAGMQDHAPGRWLATPITHRSADTGGEPVACSNPGDQQQVIGQWSATAVEELDAVVTAARNAQAGWEATSVVARAACLDQTADLLETQTARFVSLLVYEAGKTLGDCIAEIREAIDFCRYYAMLAREQFGSAQVLPGPTGEHNEISLHGRGVFVCISPWNFPLAIFAGQVVAALVAGNAVIAKPAEQTPLVAHAFADLLRQAGIPDSVFQLVLGDGATVGATLCQDPRVAGVCFTGSTETARRINRSLADRDAPLAAFIAETGGQNCLIADSSALPEQLVSDVIRSAFHSAGQRCSALRVLFIQDDIADKVVTMLAGAMAELVVGDPALIHTDIGPVIDAEALASLRRHVDRMDREARLIARAPLADSLTERGAFFAPSAYEIDSLAQLESEVFGPVLHVIRYRSKDLNQVIDAINGTGYGLTLGIHSRVERTVEHIAAKARVGNCYVNRNMIGAVVGVQPFGGEGLSGTGPKAGGPNYLRRFATERTLTIDTTAAGGNASLLSEG